MRWKRKKKQQPKEGDTRIVDWFLLFPKCLDDEWRWLELTQIHQEYQPGEYCKAIQCLQYNAGKFDNKCEECKAFIYYQWLKDNGYCLLIVEPSIEQCKARRVVFC